MLLLPLLLAAETPPTDWVADDAHYRIRIVTDSALDVSAEYHFTAIGGNPAERILVGPELLVLDTSGNTLATSDGLMFQVSPRVNLRGLLTPVTAGESTLAVLPAARQHVEIDAPGLDVTIDGAVDGWLANADHLVIHWAPHVEVSGETPAPLVLAEVGTAAWVAEGALESRTAVRWRVRRGEVSSFSVDVGALTDVEVTGGNVARWERSGRLVTIETLAPVRGGFSANITGRLPLAAGESDLPCPTPLDVIRVDKWWTLARSDEGELIPVSGPEGVTSRMLPSWAQGLAESAPLAYWHGDAPVRVLSARYDPVAGPDTVIERAEFVAASNEDGRTLLRATLRVRNERKQYLHVRPSPGFRLLATRVSGTPVSVLSDGADGYYVPMEKSIETVRGLLTFPVELTWIGEGGAWLKKGTKTVSLPSVDAPIQAAQWELHLPRGVVAIGATAARPKLADPSREAAGEALNNAMAAYKKNDFSGSQGWLDQAKEAAPEDEDVQRLQSNLDVLFKAPASTTTNEDVTTRRVRDLAHAKTSSMSSYQSTVEEQAKDAIRQGDYDKAESYLQEIATLATELDRTAQLEDAEQKNKIADVKVMLESVREGKKAKQKAQNSEERADNDADGVPDASDGHAASITFTGDFIEGNLGGFAGGDVGGMEAGATTASQAELPGLLIPTFAVDGNNDGAAYGEPVDMPEEKPADEFESSSDTTISSGEHMVLAGADRPTFRLPNLMPAKPVAAGPRRPPANAVAAPPPPAPPPRQAAHPVGQAVGRGSLGLRGQGSGGGGSGYGSGGGEARAGGRGESTLENDGETGRTTALMDGRPAPDAGVQTGAMPSEKRAEKSEEKAGKFDAHKGMPAANRNNRAALQAHATPMTVAMPMGGTAIEHTAALLESNTFPTFTLRYRTTTGVY